MAPQPNLRRKFQVAVENSMVSTSRLGILRSNDECEVSHLLCAKNYNQKCWGQAARGDNRVRGAVSIKLEEGRLKNNTWS